MVFSWFRTTNFPVRALNFFVSVEGFIKASIKTQIEGFDVRYSLMIVWDLYFTLDLEFCTVLVWRQMNFFISSCILIGCFWIFICQISRFVWYFFLHLILSFFCVSLLKNKKKQNYFVIGAHYFLSQNFGSFVQHKIPKTFYN